MKTTSRILRQTAESESFRFLVERRHLVMAADEIDKAGAEIDRLENLLSRAISGLKHIGKFRNEHGDDPHPLDCHLAGRVSHVFGTGMTRAIELCREFGHDPEWKEQP